MVRDGFTLEGSDVELDTLASEIEHRAGAAIDVPLAAASDETSRTTGPIDPFAALLRSLSEDADTAQGFPPQSHRALGGAVVAAKRGFRLAFQPLINEALSRQKLFNRRLLDILSLLHAENQRLSERIKELEAAAKDR
jgi:hypothetical protein